MNKQILKELYKIDPTLQEYESDLIKVLDKLITTKPDISLDEEFVKILKSELLSEEPKKRFNLFNFIIMKKLSIGVAGAAVILLAVVVSMNFVNKTELNQLALDKSKITRLDDRAFGSLNLQNNEPVVQDEAVGLGGGGTFKESASMDGAVSNERLSMPNPFSVQYKYVYTGEEFSIDEGSMEVLKRRKGLNVSPQLSLDLDQIDLKKFSNTELQNINLMEDKEYGYMINVNFTEGAISINQNWQTWPRPEMRCASDGIMDTKCMNNNRIKIDDVPSDNKLIDIADSFVKKYNINLSDYGEAQVDNRWRDNYDSAEDKNNYYIPETISVIYPLELYGKQIHNYSGDSDGIMVSVNIREMKVTGAWNIMSNNYQSSLYNTEQDTNKLIKLAELGGGHNVFYESTEEIAEIELGTPELIYVKTYNYNNGNSEELIVPSLLFPITKKPNDIYLWQKNIIVPVLQELVDEKLSDNPVPMPRPMPEPILYEEDAFMDIEDEETVSTENH